MKAQVLSGLGALMMILPCLSMGISYADTDAWPPLSDIRWVLIIFGVILLVVGRALSERELADRD